MPTGAPRRVGAAAPRRLLLLTSLARGACVFVGPPLLNVEVEGGGGRTPRDDLRSIARLMQDVDAELLRNATGAPVDASAACHKLEVLSRQLRRNIEGSLATLDRACRAPDGTLNEPSQVVPALSAFLDKEVWVVNATMRAMTRATRDLVDVLPQDASRRAAPYLASLDGLAVRLMSAGQGELRGLSEAAERGCGAKPVAGGKSAALVSRGAGAAGAGVASAWSSWREMRGSLAAVRRPDWGADPASPAPPGVRELQAVQVSSTFMALSQEVLVEAVGAMGALEETIRSMAADALLLQRGCDDAEGPGGRPVRSAAVARGGLWARLLCLPALLFCAAAC